MEIKFKPEPEKKDTGAGTSPEEKTAGTEENVSAAEIAEQTAETAGTEEPEAEKLAETEENVTEKSVGIKRRRRSKKSPVTDSEINGEDGVAGAGRSGHPEGDHSGKSGGSRDLNGAEALRTLRRTRSWRLSARRWRKSQCGLWQKILLGAGAVVLAVMLTFGFSIWREYSRTESTEGNPVEVTIEEGSSTRQVAQELKDAGVIRYETAFLMKIYFSDNRGKLRYGTFALNDGMCLDDVIAALVTGGAQKEEQSFTIPEGYSIPMIAEKLGKRRSYESG